MKQPCSTPGCGFPDGRPCINCGLIVEPPKNPHVPRIPQTLKEVEEMEKHLATHPVKLPDNLKDSKAILERIKARKAAQALGRLGGKAGRGPSKARTTEQARAAVAVRWAKRNQAAQLAKQGYTPLPEDCDREQ